LVVSEYVCLCVCVCVCVFLCVCVGVRVFVCVCTTHISTFGSVLRLTVAPVVYGIFFHRTHFQMMGARSFAFPLP